MKIYKYGERCNISGKKIRKLREKRQLTQEQLAAKMQVEGIPLQQKSISRIEDGSRVVADYELKNCQISEAPKKVSPSQALGGALDICFEQTCGDRGRSYGENKDLISRYRSRQNGKKAVIMLERKAGKDKKAQSFPLPKRGGF